MTNSCRWIRSASAAMLVMCAASAWGQIKIGQPSGFTGAVSSGVKENTTGANLYLDAVNAKGGVNGQKIQLISVDDQFTPARTAELGRELITKQGVIALFLTRGTPHSQALFPVLDELKVPLVGPSTGAMVMHEPVNPWVFNVRATYQREAARAIEHLASIGLQRIALLPTDDSFGADSALGAEKGLADAGLKSVYTQKFPRDKPDFTEIAQQVAQTKAQAVMIVASAANVNNATIAIRAAGSSAQIVTLSNNASNGFIKLLGDNSRGVIVSQVFPYERRIHYPLIREAQDLAKAKGITGISPAMVEGFAAAKVLVEGLRRAGPNPTPSSLRNALEGLNEYDLGGLKVSYSKINHTGLDFADLAIIDRNGRFRR